MSKKALNICFILEHYYPHVGGAEIIFKEYITRLSKLGQNVNVITSNSGGIEGISVIDGIKVHGHKWKSFFGHPVPNINDIEKAIQEADIVHTATYTAGPIAQRIAKKYSKPCVITVYEVLGRKWLWVESNLILALCYLFFEKYVISRPYTAYHAISHATEKDLINCGVKRKKIVTIYPGVDIKDRKRVLSTSKNKYFLYFGRPGKTKGIFILFNAFKKIHKELNNYKLLYILSNDPLSEKQKLKRLVKKDNLTNQIKIIDSVSKKKLIRIIQKSFCVVVPSITEGFGLSALESCILGAPIIASDAGSLPEVVYGRKVLFFKNRDIDDLTNKIKKAIYGEYEIVSKKNFSWNKSVNYLADLYIKSS